MRRRADGVELRLFIEELACNICRFMHTAQDNVQPQSVRIKQEVALGNSNAFADIVVHVPDAATYIVEVDVGCNADQICESIVTSGRFRNA